METQFMNALVRRALGATLFVVAAAAGAATTAVNMTALRSTTTLPDGTSVKMWGYCTADVTGASALNGATLTGGVCAAADATQSWTPGPTISVPYDAVNGTTLQINLTNAMKVPTSIVVLGQLGGGLGTPSRIQGFAQHAPQTVTTWTGNTASTFTPPAQAARVSSFGTEVGPAAAATTLTWDHLRLR